MKATLATDKADRVLHVAFIAGFFASGSYSLTALPIVLKGLQEGIPDRGSFAGALLLWLVACSGVFNAAYMLYHSWHQRFTRTARADRAFLYMIYPVPYNLLATLFVPGFATAGKHAWPAYLTWIMSVGVLSDITPGHSLIQLIVTFPILTFADYYKKCQLPSAYPQICMFHSRGNDTGFKQSGGNMEEADVQLPNCCGTASFVHHFATHGPLILAYGVLVICIAQIMVIRHRKSMLNNSDPARKAAAAESDAHWGRSLPLETFGTHVIEALGLHRMLIRINQALIQASEFADNAILVRITCIPMGLYYLVWTLLSRAGLKSTAMISADEWLMVMAVFFMLGRSSNDLALLSLMQQVQGRLRTSYEIMSDMLPAHVVEYLMARAEQNRDQDSRQRSQDDTWLEQQEQDEFVVEGSANLHDEHISMENETWQQSALYRQGGEPCGRRGGSSTSAGDRLLKRVQHALATQLNLSSSTSTLSGDFYADANRVQASPISRTSFREDHSKLSPGSSFSGRSSESADKVPFVRPMSERICNAMPVSTHTPIHRSVNVSESHECVTVFFSDIVSFSTWAHDLPPDKVMGTLNDLYIRLDDILLQEMPSLYKVETIGDAYMVAANLMSPDPQHAATMVRFALRAREEAAKVPRPDMSDGTTLQLRIGLHSGPAMSGTVGKIRRRFCMFGDTINMASRTETSCPPGCIQLTAVTQALAAPFLPQHEVVLQDRGLVEVKGAAQPIHMFLAASS